MADMSLDSAPEWEALLRTEWDAGYFHALRSFVHAERDVHEVYPPDNEVLAAFERTPVSRVRVVILGQDPYHGPGQAHGLCFSVNDGVKHPPSLRNILKELNADMDVPVPQSGNLTPWADRGVLLLNATLTVRAHEAGSHQGRGWERFTDAAIARLSEAREGLVFLLWGSFAQQKESLIAKGRDHLVLKTTHPSPLSAHRGFSGCGHFSAVNAFFRGRGLPEMDWSLTG